MFNSRVILFLSVVLLIGMSLMAVAEEAAVLEESSLEKIPSDEVEAEISSLEAVNKTKVAPNVDLKEVVPMPEADPLEPAIHGPPLEPVETKVTGQTYELNPLVILGVTVPRNTSTRLNWSPEVTITGLALPTPVLVINGKNPGPTLCLTAAIHGDELNGIEVVRRIMYDIEPEKLNGTLIGVPIVNLQGFQRGSRYLTDRRDLNRYFPGYATGSLASRIANSLFAEVVSHCDYLIDLHTGSFRRNNLPQIRANMKNENVSQFVQGFDDIAIVHHPGNPGMLRSAANQRGIVAVTMELGESTRIQENQISAGVHSINSLLDKLEMYPRVLIWGDPKPAYFESVWLRVENGGILFSEIDLGDRVKQGDVLGVVTDPITNQSKELIAPVTGNVIGMAINQVVIPGFAAYHIGIESTQEAMANVEPPENEIEAAADGEELNPE